MKVSSRLGYTNNYGNLEAEKNNVEQTIHAAVQEGKKHMEIETTEDTEANLEKSAIKNGEPLNGTSQKPEEEASPKKRRKGEKREREVVNTCIYYFYFE